MKNHTKIKFILAGAIFFLLHSQIYAQLSEIEVTRVDDDSDPGSLRYAINEVNSMSKDKIVFNIQQPGVTEPYIIYLESALPDITRQIYIDGGCADGANPTIVIDGQKDIDVGLTLDQNGDDNGGEIRGLYFRNFKSIGIHLTENSPNITISNNIFSGIYDSDGTSPKGIYIQSNSNIIQRNAFGDYIDGNTFFTSSTNNYSYLSYQESNDGAAIYIEDGLYNTIGEDDPALSTKGNIINFNSSYGIEIIALDPPGAYKNTMYSNTIANVSLMGINLNRISGAAGNNDIGEPTIALVIEYSGENTVTVKGDAQYAGTVQLFETGSNKEEAYCLLGKTTTQGGDFTFTDIPKTAKGYVVTITTDDDGTSQFGKFASSGSTGTNSSTGDPLPCDKCVASFAPIPGKTYVLSAWVMEEDAPETTINYEYASIKVDFVPSRGTVEFSPSGRIIDGWQRIEGTFTVPKGSRDIKISLNNSYGSTPYDIFFDDIRVHPKKGNMKSFVYDPVSLKLLAEMDENNYATYYEYDEEGKLIRIKKETERGKKTIQESFTSLKK